MTWLNDFYLSSNITDDRKLIRKRINRQKDILEYYLLAVSNHGEGVDIIPALELGSWPQRKKDSMLIVGVSNGYVNAKALADSLSSQSFHDIKPKASFMNYFAKSKSL